MSGFPTPLPRRRPSRKGPPASPLTIILLIVIVLLFRYFDPPDSSPPARQSPTAPAPEVPAPHQPTEQAPADPQRPPADSQTLRVRRVVDGDTLLMENGDRVRLQGIDTPETKKENTPVEPFGPEASEFTRQLVEGKVVRLEFDRERYDQYHRTLAYVYVGELLVNEEIIRQGFSAAQTQYSYRSDMKRRFLEAEKLAREQGIGIWSLPPAARRNAPDRR